VADKHPYSPGGPGGITAAITQLRKSFPKSVDADTLKKLQIAPSNESYIINILRFIGAIDLDGSRTDAAAATFSKADDEFKSDFESMLRKAYSGLFELRGEDAWTLPGDKLKGYFRGTDQTSDIVGRNQANTFLALASLAGHGEAPKPTAAKSVTKDKAPKVSKRMQNNEGTSDSLERSGSAPRNQDFGLTVRIEVNLPQQGDQDTYDKIFRSIRDNLFPNAK
jgi:hypothetical protein